MQSISAITFCNQLMQQFLYDNHWRCITDYSIYFFNRKSVRYNSDEFDFLLSWGIISEYHLNIKPIAWMICHCGTYKTRLRWQSSSDDDGGTNADVTTNSPITNLGRIGIISLRVTISDLKANVRSFLEIHTRYRLWKIGHMTHISWGISVWSKIQYLLDFFILDFLT